MPPQYEKPAVWIAIIGILITCLTLYGSGAMAVGSNAEKIRRMEVSDVAIQQDVKEMKLKVGEIAEAVARIEGRMNGGSK